jgi:hypothetical protein
MDASDDACRLYILLELGLIDAAINESGDIHLFENKSPTAKRRADETLAALREELRRNHPTGVTGRRPKRPLRPTEVKP